MSRPQRLGTAAGALVVLLMASVRSDAQPLLGPSRSGERLGTIAASWLDGALVVETWNDRFGAEHRDHGPTGGGRIYVRIHDLRWPLSLLP